MVVLAKCKIHHPTSLALREAHLALHRILKLIQIAIVWEHHGDQKHDLDALDSFICHWKGVAKKEA